MARSNGKKPVSYMPLVGSKGWKPADIVKILQNDDTASATLFDKWSELALHLDVREAYRRQLEAEMKNTSHSCHMSMVERILTDWKARKGSEASVANLIQVFKNMNMNLVAEILESVQCSSSVSVSNEMIVGKQQKGITWKHLLYSVLFLAVILVLGFIGFLVYDNIITERPNQNEVGSDKNFTLLDIPNPPNESEEQDIDRNISVSSYDEYQSAIANIKSCCVHLYISIGKASVWNYHSKMKNAEQIRSIFLSGSVTRHILLNILLQTYNANNLLISNRENVVCEAFHEQSNQVNTRNTNAHIYSFTSLVFSDFTSCETFYKSFGTYLQIENIRSVKILNSTFTSANTHYIQNMLYKSEKTLKYLELHGNSNSSQTFYRPGKVLSKVKALVFNINSKSTRLLDKRQEHFFDLHLCNSLPNLEHFESTVGISYKDILDVLKCKNLKNLTATVLFGEDDEFYNINAGIVSNQLIYIELVFDFIGNCPNVEQIIQLGLHEIRKIYTTKIVSNCSIATNKASSDEEEIEIVEEYRKNIVNQ